MSVEPRHSQAAHSYRPISDYALIGNGQTAALIGRNGSIDWCCWPRFDSPAVFCRLLDDEIGGFFQIVPAAGYRVARQYVGPTNVLRTTFTTDDGVVELTDFMPAPRQSSGEDVFPHRVLRRLQCVSGRVDIKLACYPSFDFARQDARFQLRENGAIAFGDGEALSLVSSLEVEHRGDRLIGRKTLAAGEDHWITLTHGPASDAEDTFRFMDRHAQQEYQRTIAYWETWSEVCQYEGPYRELVLRSALALKLLVFQPSGGLVAAPTTSLPDEIGGMRNWDYRYTWLRDSGLVLDALQQLGYHDESMQFIDWLQNSGLDREDHPKIMYTVDGQPAPDERSLEHLAGYRGSRPVRVGNGAVEQTQTDIYGHVLDAVVLCFERMPRDVQPELWDFLCSLADRIASHWQQHDKGPWEVRGPAKHYLYSKLYCWVGLERVVRFAEQQQLSGDIQEWKKQREAVRDAILSRGYNRHIGAFTQVLDGDQLDATVLVVPLAGLLPIEDDRVQSTIRVIEQRLTENSLVYRYKLDDGLPGSDASFALCSFWLIMDLAMSGQVTKAQSLFEHICGFANDVGLLSEQINPASGELLGNFPQGFTHLGLIRAALHLSEAEKKS